MELTIEKSGIVRLVSVRGSVDLRSAGRLYDALVSVALDGGTRLIVDLAGVTQLTRAGVRGIIVAAKLVQAARGRMRICGADANTEALLQDLGHNHLLQRDPDRAAALAELVGWPHGKENSIFDLAVSRAEFLTGIDDVPSLLGDIVGNKPGEPTSPASPHSDPASSSLTQGVSNSIADSSAPRSGLRRVQ